MPRGQRLTPAQQSDIIARYNTGLTTYQVANQLGLNGAGVYGVLKRHGIPMRKFRFPAHDIDNTFFDKIDTREKAYMLGWLYADGCNEPKRRRIRISLKVSDKGMLEQLGSYIRYKGSVHTFVRKNHSFNPGGCYCVLGFQNQRLSDALVRLGCVANKSLILTFPTEEQVPRLYWRDFMRGYVEGDGTLDCYQGKLFHFSLIGTQAFIGAAAVVIEKETGVPCTARAYRQHPWLHRISKSGSIQIMTILDWLYHDCGSMRLERKHQAYLRMKRIYEIRRPRPSSQRQRNSCSGRWMPDSSIGVMSSSGHLEKCIGESQV